MMINIVLITRKHERLEKNSKKGGVITAQVGSFDKNQNK